MTPERVKGKPIYCLGVARHKGTGSRFGILHGTWETVVPMRRGKLKLRTHKGESIDTGTRADQLLVGKKSYNVEGVQALDCHAILLSQPARGNLQIWQNLLETATE